MIFPLNVAPYIHYTIWFDTKTQTFFPRNIHYALSISVSGENILLLKKKSNSYVTPACDTRV